MSKIASGEYSFEQVSCPCCGSDVHGVVSNFDRDFLPVQIVLCRDCGMMYQRRRLDQKSLSGFYSHEYRDLYNPGFRGNSEVYRQNIEIARADYETIMGMLGGTPRFVCEVGMHFGALLSQFVGKECRVAGTDYDAAGIRFAREELGLSDVFVGPSTELLKLGDKPDLLMYMHVLEHINDLDGEFEIMREILPDGGHLFLSVPGVLSWPARQENDILHTLQLAHSHYFSLPHLVHVAARHGFRFLQGDSEVRALFVKTPEADISDPVPNEYEIVYKELKRMDRLWAREKTFRKLKQIFGIK
ncbi:class I SAM-dependent methyltransferase [Salidesulfovibrio onnuriiensis]|uniref:class I SAM-dependent methyltransferase n=1 Tax=Salidesulfovibrio onnuriiensis TaxID=2583823 RepID=UPI001650A889|nr:methyltransferase domain-containing protein [Salidesulfovibrio onnuriiensis]